MMPKDEKKTFFIIDQGLYCYKIMTFGLKNIEATYQRLINRIFKNQVGRNMNVYINGMLVKNYQAEQHIMNLKKTFKTLRKYCIKLNPNKCIFGIA